MKKSRYSDSQIIKILKQAEAGAPVPDLCREHGIEHRLTKFRHPWTNGQVEIRNKKIKNHTTKTYHYEGPEQLKRHLMSYLMVYNYQRPLKELKFKTPYAKIIEMFEQKPQLFNYNPHQKNVGLNN